MICTGWTHDDPTCRVSNKKLCGVTTAEGIESMSDRDWEQEKKKAAEKGGGQEGFSAAINRNWPNYHKSLCLSRSDYCHAEANMGGMSSRDEGQERKEAAEKGSGKVDGAQQVANVCLQSTQFQLARQRGAASVPNL